MQKFNIDLSDLNYLIFREEKNLAFVKRRYTKSRLVLFLNIVKVVLRAIYGLLYFNKRKLKNNEKIDFLFYYITSNNKRALEPVYECMDNAVLAGPNELNNRASWKYGILYIGKVLKQLQKEENEYLRKVYTSEFVELCLTYCYYHNAKKQLNAMKPNFLILSNDHIAHARAFMRVGQQLGINTVYLQHASITDKFPPLEFDYAFLDGQESFDKYKKAGVSTKNIYLEGNPRFDIIPQLVKPNKEKKIQRLGISINLADHWIKVYELIQSIVESNNIKLSVELRPHPAMNMRKVIDFFEKLDIKISNPQKENPFVFINNNDVFISCESSIHLDTVLANKISLYYNLLENSEPQDAYGYIKTGLIVDITENPLDALLDIINHNFEKYSKDDIKQYYVANYNTSSWGNSSQEIAKTLLELYNLND